MGLSKSSLPGMTKYTSLRDAFKAISNQCKSHHDLALNNIVNENTKRLKGIANANAKKEESAFFKGSFR